MQCAVQAGSWAVKSDGEQPGSQSRTSIKRGHGSLTFLPSWLQLFFKGGCVFFLRRNVCERGYCAR